MPSFLKPSFGFSSFGWRNSGVTTDEAPDEAEGNEDENVGVTSRLRLVFAGRRVEDQIQQVCFNQFILSKTPNQRDRPNSDMKELFDVHTHSMALTTETL